MSENISSANLPVVGKPKWRILVVEDDRVNARIITSILKSADYEVRDVGSGEEAIGVFEDYKPDLILLDIILPGINGLETCRKLKSDHGAGSIPVVFITARNQVEDIVAGFEAGGVDYLVKPFQPKETLARIRTHLSLRALLESQAQLVDELSKASAAKNHFLSIAAHDLRNPITSIKGLSECLLEGDAGEMNEEQCGIVRTVHSASTLLLNMLNELLDISIMEAGELRVEPVLANFGDIVQDSVFLNSVNAARKQMRIQHEPFRLRGPINIDIGKIRQVVDNLLSNAIKFSPPGAIITVAIMENEESQMLFVRDQGPGIPQNEMGKLFKNFGRTSVRPTGGEKSTGLGLAICAKIVEAHRGHIFATNSPEGGAEFRVTLPKKSHAV